MKAIKYDTLILNKHWAPIHIVDWKRTVNLMYQGIGQALDNDFMAYTFESWLEYSKQPRVLDDGYMFVNSPNLKVAIPDIIVLKEYGNFNVREVKFSRENTFHRDKFRCMYCGDQFRRDDLTIDHIIPKSRGGTNSWKNVVACCKPCNHKKADRTPKEAGIKLLSPPTEPQWHTPLNKAAGRPDIRPAWKNFLKSMATDN